VEPVSAEEVRGVKFRTSRMRVGYNMADVDAFLDRVESTIADLSIRMTDARDEVNVLRSQCEQLRLRLEAVDRHDTQPVPASDESAVLAREIRLRLRRVLQEQLALLED
jgi:DivIVA domain-containing protein